MIRRVGIEIIIFLYIVLFLYAAESKFFDHRRFTAQIGQSPLLSDHAMWIAWVIPTLEVIIVVLLLIHGLRLYGLYASFGLMTLFTLYIIAIMSFSEELPCACGGILSELHWKGHLLFNLVFVALAVVGIILMNRETVTQRYQHEI